MTDEDNIRRRSILKNKKLLLRFNTTTSIKEKHLKHRNKNIEPYQSLFDTEEEVKKCQVNLLILNNQYLIEFTTNKYNFTILNFQLK